VLVPDEKMENRETFFVRKRNREIHFKEELYNGNSVMNDGQVKRVVEGEFF
jgi:hypothetical protein